MIELAPRHKVGLPVHTPVLLAGGSIGYGDATHRGLDLAQFGAAVVGPMTRRPLLGTQPPRLADATGGVVLESGLQNRGVQTALKKFARLWPRLGLPLIAQIADPHPADAATTARRLLDQEAILGLELLLPMRTTPEELLDLIKAIRRESDLPLWIKPSLADAPTLAPVAAELGVDGMVVGQPPPAAGFHSNGIAVTGALFGPAAFASMLAVLLTVARQQLPLTLIASGGIHTQEQAEHALQAGATALQVDSLVWVEPGLAVELARHFLAHA